LRVYTVGLYLAYLGICQLAEGSYGFVELGSTLSVKVGSDFRGLFPEPMDSRREYFAKLRRTGSLSFRSKAAQETDELSQPILFPVFEAMPSCSSVASTGEKMIKESSNNSTTQKRNYKRNIKSWLVWHISAFLLGVLGGFIGYSIINAITSSKLPGQQGKFYP
jgi:hypothetical protein